MSRRFDDQTQNRIQQETQAIGRIIPQMHIGHWYWISSDVLVDEVEQIPDLSQRFQVKDRLTNAHQFVSVGVTEISRGRQLEFLGFKGLDALHLACAESGNADIFLTTDDGLLRRAKRYNAQLRVRVENPYTWLQEVIGNERIRDDR